MKKMVLKLSTIHGSYYCEDINFDDGKLYIFKEFLDLIPCSNPDWIIQEIRNRTGGIVIVQFKYKDGRVIIYNELDEEEAGPYISVKEDKLYELVKKWAKLKQKNASTISLVRNAENYEIIEE